MSLRIDRILTFLRAGVHIATTSGLLPPMVATTLGGVLTVYNGLRSNLSHADRSVLDAQAIGVLRAKSLRGLVRNDELIAEFADPEGGDGQDT